MLKLTRCWRASGFLEFWPCSLAAALGSTAVHYGVRMRRTAVGAFALLSTIGCDDLCGNKVLTDVASPDVHNHAVVFERDCGATTGFSTQVSILPAGRAISDGGNVLIVDDDHGRAPNGPGGGPSVEGRGARALGPRHHLSQNPLLRVWAPVAASAGRFSAWRETG